ncbi:hypothetical protein Q4487_03360 [Cellulophaga sp. 3_MG-2023]|uniref:DUF6891 domain-containing protein n=1 Tax=Cellulophaga sp. 3_MG-2023 TaxID=3062675 RepID=UPI0026E3D7ED|nr:MULTISPECIES: hypothetical protein [unclassified Cellulophaga]MDO6491009.1 hypothetical protein [Cellulophaga sp. 2_MG-2023]MDO6493797.1 hypothetical protein [Cellulophaga sp. 3_MG-2023]
MTENQEFIFESIFNQVRAGFTPISEIKENILEEIEDNEFDDEISEKWAIDTIEKEYNKLVLESKNWKNPTDTERLIEAFDELCSQNIIALHNAGYTTSDGEYEVVHVERSLLKKQTSSDGYCFYHEQDLSRALSTENPSLYIAFQKVNNSDNNVTLEVGKKIVKVLTNKGFNVKWDNDVNTKILIQDFKWQHIYKENGRDLLDFDKVAELISENKGITIEAKSIADFYLETDVIDNNNPTLTDVLNAIEDMKYKEEDPSFIVLDFTKKIANILYIQAVINKDSSYDIELRTGNAENFNHYRYITKDKNELLAYFTKMYNKIPVDYSSWLNVTEEFTA